MHRSELQSAAGVSPIPTVVMEIPKEVCNLKDRRSDLRGAGEKMKDTVTGLKTGSACGP